MIQGGIDAAYGNEGLYKVYAVTMISPLKKMASQERKDHSGQHADQQSENAFSEVLDQECKKENQTEIQFQAKGYTRNAMPYNYMVYKRDYTQC